MHWIALLVNIVVPGAIRNLIAYLLQLYFDMVFTFCTPVFASILFLASYIPFKHLFDRGGCHAWGNNLPTQLISRNLHSACPYRQFYTLPGFYKVRLHCHTV